VFSARENIGRLVDPALPRSSLIRTTHGAVAKKEYDMITL
jgi:hypothetical protein